MAKTIVLNRETLADFRERAKTDPGSLIGEVLTAEAFNGTVTSTIQTIYTHTTNMDSEQHSNVEVILTGGYRVNSLSRQDSILISFPRS